MAESMRDAKGQENGTIHTGQHFGPAKRTHYPAEQWALAPIASSREVVDHPPPAKRRRITGQPAFLRGPPGDDIEYNAPLLTIFHGIPLAREALLFPPMEVFTYGHNPDWWAGTTDENIKSLSLPHTSIGDDDRRRYLCEMQCLMAFLDNTNRAYGSVDALSEMSYLQYFRRDYDRFLVAWNKAAMEEQDDNPLTQVFTSVAAKGFGIAGASHEVNEIMFIKATVEQTRTLPLLLDRVIWNDFPGEDLDDIWLEKLGHICVMHITNPVTGATGLNIAATEILYMDRYTQDLREAAMQMRARCRSIWSEMRRLNKVQERIAEMPGPQRNSARVSIRKALEMAREVMPIAAEESLRETDLLIDDGAADIDADRIVRQINELLAEVDTKLKDLERERNELKDQVAEIMSDLMDPETSSQPLRYKYTLQGVSTKPNVTYVRKLNPDLIGIDDEEEVHEAWQWWRCAWDETRLDGDAHVTDAKGEKDAALPYSIRKVSVSEVLEAVRSEHHVAVLVYADETAMNFRPSPLPASLRQFVDMDNQAFEAETSPQYVQHVGRTRSWSEETNSTVNGNSDPFDDTSYQLEGREATPMSTSTSTIQRSPDGQPSPKRPKSSDETASTMDWEDAPPSYETVTDAQAPEMVQRKGNKIGYLADQMLQKYGTENPEKQE